jgi:hypothetical protein
MDHHSKPGPQSRKFPVGNPTKRGKVLRAADVIPPFTANTQPPEDGLEIPSYDLAENILAEQRQAAGRRRRGPGEGGGTKTDDRRQTTEGGAVLRSLSSVLRDPAAQDLLELQRVVAEIVARDIERLCRRPERSSIGGRVARSV